MNFTSLRDAGWIAMLGMTLAAGRSLLAADDIPADQQTPAVQQATPAKEPMPLKKSAKPRAGERAQDAAKPQGRVLIPKYRLGAAFAPVPPELDKQHGLKGEGLLIERVGPGAPAIKAGVKPGDILLAIDNKPIKKYGDSVEWLNASGGKASLTLLRDGKKITAVVTLEKHRKGDEKILVR